MSDGHSSLTALLFLVAVFTFFLFMARRAMRRREEERIGRRREARAVLRQRDESLIVDSSGRTLLMQAAAQGFEEGVARILAGAGRDAVNFVTRDGTTALHCAMASGNSAIVSRLLSAGADPNGADARGRTPLWLAAQTENARLVSLLLDYGAQPEQRVGPRGMTPLMAAARNGRSEVVEVLIARGADPLAVSGEGLNALEYGRENLADNMGGSHARNEVLARMVLRLEEATRKV